jgi:RNA polymerase sigma factor (sigma-70 family)
VAPGDGDSGLDGELLAAVRQLPVRQQQVIILRVFFDLDARATAQALGIAPGTVGVHLHRALAVLRAQMPSPANQEATE